MDCHVTLPWGSCNGGDDITPGSAALRDFKPAYDCSGSNSALRPCRLQCPVCPKKDRRTQSRHCNPVVAAIRGTAVMERRSERYSGLMLAARMTSPHFSVKS